MKRQWRRSEARPALPFATATEALGGVKFRLLKDDEFSSGEHFEVEPEKVAVIRPEFFLAVDKEEPVLREIGPRSVSLVISLRDLHLRRSEVVFSVERLTDAPEGWEVPADIRQRFAWKAGVEASVALVLASEKEPKGGLPFMRGHCVARRRFSIRPKASPKSFPIVSWTADDFVRRGLPADTAFTVQLMTDDFNRAFQEPGDAFVLALRDDVFEALSDAEETSAGRAVRSLMLAEVATEITWVGLKNLADAEIDSRGMLGRILERIHKSTGADVYRLQQLIKKEDRPALRAHVQAALGSRRQLARIRGKVAP